MLAPKFLLTKTVPLTVFRRTSGAYVNGEWIEGTTVEVQRNANIQPLREDELLILPESERSKEWYKLYSDQDLRTQKEGAGGYDADEFNWQGDRYKVMKVRNYAMGTLNHYRALAVRIELTPTS